VQDTELAGRTIRHVIYVIDRDDFSRGPLAAALFI
jgi:hypothetical protein